MLSRRGTPVLTAGSLARLALVRSPFVYGGEITDGALEYALKATGFPSGESLSAALSTAFRILEIIVNDGHLRPPSYRPFDPEWFADVYASACRSSPSLTWDGFLWEMPLSAVFHLCAASHRAAGGVTERPKDYDSFFAGLKEIE